MSLWDWLFGKISSPRDDASLSSMTDSSANAGRSAVATLPSPGERATAADSAAEQPWWLPEPDAWLEPQSIPRPDLSPEARALENILISHFDGHDLQVPPLMQVAENVLRKLSKADCNFNEIARELSEDPVIAGSVLRLANSPLYRGTNKISSVQQGVTRLGQKAVRTLMLHESMRSAMFGKKGRDGLAEALWKRSLASAVVMRELARICGNDEDDAYLLGLLHDIGAVLVLRILRGELRFGKFQIEEEEFDYLCQEAHQEFGELMAAEWKLPQSVATIISDHHRHPAPDDENRIGRLQILLSDMIVSMIGLGITENYDLCASAAARDLGIAERQDFRAMLDAIPERVADVLGAL